MKRLLVSTAALAAAISAQTASAQSYNWSGPYVGVYAGLNAAETDTQDYWCDAACDAPLTNANDIAAGVTIGYNHQVDDNFVIGLEGDFGTGANKTDHTTYGYETVRQDYYWKSKLDWMATIRARAGLAAGRTLFFVTGGLALTHADLSETTIDTESPPDWGARHKGTLTGYAVGGGVEHVVGNNMTVKAEYLRTAFQKKDACYVDLEGEDAGICWDANYVAVDDYVAWKPSVDVVRIGVNYKF